MTLQEYVNGQLLMLIESVAEAARCAEVEPSEQRIHRLRVSIRRLRETLRVFREALPHGAAKRVRKELQEAMRSAGEARNCDIARDLRKKAKVPIDPRLADARQEAVNHLGRVLRGWIRYGAADAWRKRLHA